MLKPRILLPAVGVCALVASGCFMTQAQVFTHFDLPSPFTIDSGSTLLERIPVDLNTIPDYRKHKDNLNGLSDAAVVGKFTNIAGGAGSVEIWITPDATSYTTIAQVKANGTLMWSGSIGATGSVHTFDWDESARLFNSAGKAILIHEAKGDGVFTIYAFGTQGVYTIKVEDGSIMLTIDGGV